MAIDKSITKKCKTCGSDYSGNRCIACKLAYTARWREKNKDRIHEYSVQYYKNNADHILEKKKNEREENPLEHRQRTKKWRDSNPLKNKEVAARSHANNKEKNNKRSINYRLANLDRYRAYAHNRRALIKLSGGKLSPEIASKILALQKGRCACCGEPLGSDYHLDHIMPLALGGTNTDDNIQLLRSTCNRQKYAKHPVDFMQQRGFLL